MNHIVAGVENKIMRFILQNEPDWMILCGLRDASYDSMRKTAALLRKEELYELEAMLLWKMEALELDQLS